jgi:hypothetical protein
MLIRYGYELTLILLNLGKQMSGQEEHLVLLLTPETTVLKGLDIMDTQTLLIIIILVLLLGGGGWYGRGRWF